jgi:hypothetical protein
MIATMIASLRYFLGWMVSAFRSREDLVDSADSGPQFSFWALSNRTKKLRSRLAPLCFTVHNPGSMHHVRIRRREAVHGELLN